MANFRVIKGAPVEDAVNFDNGYTAYVKHELTMGDHIQLHTDVLRLEKDGAFTAPLLTVMLLELFLIRIEGPQGEAIEINRELLQSMDSPTLLALNQEVMARYVPFVTPELPKALTSRPSTGSGAKPSARRNT